MSVTLPGADNCTVKESRERLNERVFEFLDQVQGSIVKKKNVYQYFAGDYTKEEILASLTGLELTDRDADRLNFNHKTQKTGEKITYRK